MIYVKIINMEFKTNIKKIMKLRIVRQLLQLLKNILSFYNANHGSARSSTLTGCEIQRKKITKKNIETLFNVKKKVDLNKNHSGFFFLLSVPMYTEATINHSLKH